MTGFTSPSGFDTAVLFVIFNRPETTRIVFEAIRQARPPRLYVSADGPRPQVDNDEIRCDEARAVIKKVDWPCEVRTLFREGNLGCGKALSSGITWFFDHEAEGIILEDDCLPSESFFGYCQELLCRYRNDTRVMHIGGNNFLRGWTNDGNVSYYFSLSGHIWGWASWARAWKKYDFSISKFEAIHRMGYFRRFFLNTIERYYRIRKFKQIVASRLDTWDYQWDFARFINSGLAIVPIKNLVKNIGYGTSATHTKEGDHEYGNLEVNDLPLPLSHPPHVIRDRLSDEKYFRVLMSERIISKLWY
jgi:hypothetical protein